MNKVYEDLKQKLLLIRKSLEITQVEAANRSGIPLSSYNLAEIYGVITRKNHVKVEAWIEKNKEETLKMVKVWSKSK